MLFLTSARPSENNKMDVSLYIDQLISNISFIFININNYFYQDGNIALKNLGITPHNVFVIGHTVNTGSLIPNLDKAVSNYI